MEKLEDKVTLSHTCYVSVNASKIKLTKLWEKYRTAQARGKKRQSNACESSIKYKAKLGFLFNLLKRILSSNYVKKIENFCRTIEPISIEPSASETDLLVCFKSKKERHEQEKNAEKEKETLTMLSLDDGGNASSNDDDYKNFCELPSKQPKIFEHIFLYVPRNIAFTSQVVIAADRQEITSNSLNDNIAPIIRESQRHIEDFVLSKTSTLRENVERFDTVKKNFWLM